MTAAPEDHAALLALLHAERDPRPALYAASKTRRRELRARRAALTLPGRP